MGYMVKHKKLLISDEAYSALLSKWLKRISKAQSPDAVRKFTEEWQDIERTVTRVWETWETMYDCSTKPAMAGA